MFLKIAVDGKRKTGYDTITKVSSIANVDFESV